MTRHVAFVGPDVFDIYPEFVRGLKEVGARVSGLGHTPNERLAPTLKRLLDDYERVGNLLDPEALSAGARALARRHPVDLIETADESLVLATAHAREALAVPGLSVHGATLCRDKPLMKETLRRAGVPCAASDAVDSLQALADFVEREGYPVILKPRSALGGLGTHRADDARELEAAAKKLGIDRGESAAVEEFIEGHEGFYDTISIDGEPVHEMVSHYYPNVLEALSSRHIAPQIAATNRVDMASYDGLREMGRTVIKALGIGTSATHMEWFYGPKGLKFSEIGARPPGEKLWNLYCVGNDIDLYREWAMVIVHQRRGAHLSRRAATGSIQVRPVVDGVVTRVVGLSELLPRLKPHIWAWQVPKPGTPTDPIYKGYLNNLWIRLQHPDYDQLRAMMDLIGERVRVEARPA